MAHVSASSAARCWHGVPVRSDNICSELRRLWVGEGGGGGCLKSTVALSRDAGTVVVEMLSCSKGWKGTAPGEASKNIKRWPRRSFPATFCLHIPQPYAVIPKDRQARAIWPRVRIPRTHIGNPNYAASLPFPPLRFVSAPPLHPCLSVGSSGRAPLSKPSPVALFHHNPSCDGAQEEPFKFRGETVDALKDEGKKNPQFYPPGAGSSAHHHLTLGLILPRLQLIKLLLTLYFLMVRIILGGVLWRGTNIMIMLTACRRQWGGSGCLRPLGFSAGAGN